MPKMNYPKIAYLTTMLGLIACGSDTPENRKASDKYLQYCTTIDHTKSDYALGAEYDDCIGIYAQNTTAHIETETIDVRANHLPPTDFFSALADLDQAERWVQAYYTFLDEELTQSEDMPTTIHGVLAIKMKSKEIIDRAFGLSNSKPQGTCMDVQETIYNNVLNAILTDKQYSQYRSKGKSLTFTPDDDLPPLSDTTNPVASGAAWYTRDPAKALTRQGDAYSYEPIAMYIESDDTSLPEDMDDRHKGVRYCKLLSHQIILSWMLVKSYEENPTLISPAAEHCTAPTSFEATFGSCLFYFAPSKTYYCSDYTGRGFDHQSALEKCNSRPSSETFSTKYSEKPCEERLEELSSKIPDYAGFQGLCIIHCLEEGEFLWNVYQEDPKSRCANYPYLTPEQKEAIQQGYP